MAVLSSKEIRDKLNEGYTVGLAYELLLALRDANAKENNEKKLEIQAIASEMYNLTPNKSKNDAKVLRAISNNVNSFSTLSTRASMLEADALVDSVTTNYSSKRAAANAFTSLLELNATYKNRNFILKLFGPETRALSNRIDTLKTKLSNRFGNRLVDDIMKERIEVDEIIGRLPAVPKPEKKAEEKKAIKEVKLDDSTKKGESQKSKEDILAEKDIENYVVVPKAIEKKPSESKKVATKGNNDLKPTSSKKKSIVPEGLDISEEEYLIILKQDQEMKEFYPEQQYVNPLFVGVKEAFYPVFNKHRDNYDDYCNTLINRVVNVELNEKNLEYVLLATYNIGQLNEIKNFIQNSPNKVDLEYLVNPLNYKISQLSDTKLVDTTINDLPVKVPNYKRFIIRDVSNNYYSSVKPSLDMDITSYEAFTDNAEVMMNDITTNKSVNDRLDGQEKYNAIKENPSIATKEQAIVGKNSLLIPLPPMQHQSSNNGCWSCSLQAQLNHFGVDLKQNELRALRPSYDTNDSSKNPLVTLRNRISFSYLANRDEKISMIDYAEIIHNTVKNSVVHHAEITNNFVENIKSLLDKYKTPISCTNGIHYLTFVGYDGDKLIYQDSLHTNPVEHQIGISSEMKEKYKDYCVGDCSIYASSIQNRSMELTWVERYSSKAELKAMITKNNMEYNNSIVRGTSASCFNKVENADDPLNLMITNVIISNSDAKDLGLGAFEKKAVNIEIDKKEPMEDIPVIEENNEYCLLK